MTIFALSLLFALSLYIQFFGKKYLFLLQQLSYSGKKYLRYLLDRKKSRAFSKKKPARQRLDLTKRVKRIMIFEEISILLIFGLTKIAISAIFPDISSIVYCAILAFSACVFTLSTPFFVFFGYALELPLENLIARYYEKKCEKRLSTAKIIIGITGSYGKTTIKSILKEMLSKKYSVFATPFSFNTPMGISKCVLESYSGEEVALIEIGARRIGDIKRICSFVNVGIAVITSIGSCHLESFKTLENVAKAKYELCEGKSVRAAFFGKTATALFERFPLEKHRMGENFSVSDVATDKNGLSFCLYGENAFGKVSTKLLGGHNLENILLAAEVARFLNVGFCDIIKAIDGIKSVPHRLELKESPKYVIIDDSFNANPQSVLAACEAVKPFSGEKFAITSGMIELGKTEEEENEKLGKALATAFGYVILVGKLCVEPIKRGLLALDFPKEKIFTEESLDDAVARFNSKAKTGDLVLFLNDFPDIYLS